MTLDRFKKQRNYASKVLYFDSIFIFSLQKTYKYIIKQRLASQAEK